MNRPLPVSRARSVLLTLAGSALMAAAVTGCGGGLDVKDEDRAAATTFNQYCSGCHTLKSANSYGSKPEKNIQAGERTNGPNFDQRKEESGDVLFAIRNGGFTGAIMPANVVVGDEAEALADFVARYSGTEREVSSTGVDTGP